MKKTISKTRAVLSSAALLGYTAIYGQNTSGNASGPPSTTVTSMEKIKQDMNSGGDLLLTAAEWGVYIALGLGLMVVIYMVATKNPHTREWVVGYLLAFLLFIMFKDTIFGKK